MPAAKKTKKTTRKKPANRPTVYKSEFAELAFNYTLLGATDKELADFFEVSESTIDNWKKKHSDFLGSIKKGKDEADARVAKSLYHRALGYTHEDEYVTHYQGETVRIPITKHVLPETTAAIFWLKNRQPQKWRDKQVHQVIGDPDQPIYTHEINEDNRKKAESKLDAIEKNLD